METEWIELPPDFVPGDIVRWGFIRIGASPSIQACDRAQVVRADRKTVTVQIDGNEFTVPANVPTLIDRPVSYFQVGDLVWREEDMTAVTARLNGVPVVAIEEDAVVVDYYGEQRRYTSADLREGPLVKVTPRNRR